MRENAHTLFKRVLMQMSVYRFYKYSYEVNYGQWRALSAG